MWKKTNSNNLSGAMPSIIFDQYSLFQINMFRDYYCNIISYIRACKHLQAFICIVGKTKYIACGAVSVTGRAVPVAKEDLL